MTSVDAQAVMRLRKLTGYGVMQCKLLLAEAGSVELADVPIAGFRSVGTERFALIADMALRHDHA
jgi:translation elongation factor EF-Ts